MKILHNSDLLSQINSGQLLSLIECPFTDTFQTAASICMHGMQAGTQMGHLLENYPREGAKRCRVT